MAPALRITTRNARYQQWAALLTNRTKRAQLGQFLVQGVRPITLAVQHGWPVEALLYPSRAALSPWATEVLDESTAMTVAMAPDLLHELGGRSDAPPELVAVARVPPDDLDRIGTDGGLVVVFDRPTSPGNIGTLVRSADAFGADGLLVCGHAADVYDPQAVRASTGSLFALPVVRAPAPGPVLDWAGARGLRVIGTDEHGPTDLAELDLTGPTLLLVGNETTGLSTGWRAAVHELARIPIGGAASRSPTPRPPARWSCTRRPANVARRSVDLRRTTRSGGRRSGSLTTMTRYISCPDPSCGVPAEITDWYLPRSTHGPVEHVKTLCVRRHTFILPMTLARRTDARLAA